MGFRTSAAIAGGIGLLCTDIMTAYVMRVLSTYLTNVWGLNFAHSAAIINMWEGLAKMLPLGLALISACFPNPSVVPILCTASFAIGWILMALSTPPMLAHSTGTCSHYHPECIGHMQKILFYIGFPMVTIGMSSIVVIVAFLLGDDDYNDDDDSDDDAYHEMIEETIAGDISNHPTLTYPNYIINIALSYIKPWSVRFGIPAICSILSVSLFLQKPLWNIEDVFSEDNKAKESPLTRAMRVFVASASKLCHRLDDKTELHDQTDDKATLPRTRGLRFLDKAAIVLPTKSREEQQKHRWTLCTITDVEKTKLAIRMAPLIPPIILCGVVISIGNTYFMEQANNLNPKIGKWKTSITYLLVIYDSTKSCMSGISFLFQALSTRAGISAAMFFSVLCCITAAKVEQRRLHVVSHHGLVDKPNQRIPMTMYWMVPQFVLLAIVDALLEQNVKAFILSRYRRALRLLYPLLFACAITGAGILGGILSVHLSGKFSGRVWQKVSWFQDTLNKSRMDHYYWALAALSAANLLLFVVLSSYFSCRSERVYKTATSQNQEATEIQMQTQTQETTEDGQGSTEATQSLEIMEVGEDDEEVTSQNT